MNELCTQPMPKSQPIRIAPAKQASKRQKQQAAATTTVRIVTEISTDELACKQADILPICVGQAFRRSTRLCCGQRLCCEPLSRPCTCWAQSQKERIILTKVESEHLQRLSCASIRHPCTCHPGTTVDHARRSQCRPLGRRQPSTGRPLRRSSHLPTCIRASPPQHLPTSTSSCKRSATLCSTVLCLLSGGTPEGAGCGE